MITYVMSETERSTYKDTLRNLMAGGVLHRTPFTTNIVLVFPRPPGSRIKAAKGLTHLAF